MTKTDQNTIVWLVGLWLLSKSGRSIVPALQRSTARVAPVLQRGGARLYDWLHDDAGHKQDLPGHQLTRQAVLQIATRAGFPDPKLASAIAFAESGGVPAAFVRSSREYSVGLWQINTLVHPFSVDDMKNPIKNAQAAFQISRGGTDWRAWPTYTSGKYRQFKTGIFA